MTNALILWVIRIAWFVSIPILTVLAYRGWAKSLRKDLARWRSFLGVTSLAITFLNWLLIPLLMLLDLMRIDSFLSMEPFFLLGSLTALTGAFFALALKSVSRLQAFAAAVLMAVAWLTSWVP